jgi:hypothetical protein
MGDDERLDDLPPELLALVARALEPNDERSASLACHRAVRGGRAKQGERGARWLEDGCALGALVGAQAVRVGRGT